MVLEKPCQLLEVKDGKLELQEDFESQIRSIVEENGDKPVTVVSLIGKYRGGKSTLLNELVGKPDAFPTGDGCDTMTKGVWYYIVEKKDKYIIYLDPQGNNDPGNQEMVDKLLLWCFTASSEFMYNNQGAVGQDMMKELFNLAQLQNRSVSDGSRKPHLRVLLRDFGLNLKDRSATEYLVEKLSADPDTESRNTSEKDLVRTFYPDVQVYAFTIHPDAMEKLGGPRRQDLKQDLFAEKIKQLESDISTDNNHYHVGHEELSLQKWSTLVSSHLIEAINKSTKVDLSQSWMNDLQRILNSGIKMMHSILEESSILDILAMENDAWEYMCCSVSWEVTTFYRLKWQEEIKQKYMDQLERMASSCLEKVHTVDCLADFLHNAEQLWNTDTADNNWLIVLCRDIWLKEAEKQQSKIKDQLKTLMSENEIGSHSPANEESARASDTPVLENQKGKHIQEYEEAIAGSEVIEHESKHLESQTDAADNYWSICKNMLSKETVKLQSKITDQLHTLVNEMNSAASQILMTEKKIDSHSAENEEAIAASETLMPENEMVCNGLENEEAIDTSKILVAENEMVCNSLENEEAIATNEKQMPENEIGSHILNNEGALAVNEKLMLENEIGGHIPENEEAIATSEILMAENEMVCNSLESEEAIATSEKQMPENEIGSHILNNEGAIAVNETLMLENEMGSNSVENEEAIAANEIPMPANEIVSHIPENEEAITTSEILMAENEMIFNSVESEEAIATSKIPMAENEIESNSIEKEEAISTSDILMVENKMGSNSLENEEAIAANEIPMPANKIVSHIPESEEAIGANEKQMPENEMGSHILNNEEAIAARKMRENELKNLENLLICISTCEELDADQLISDYIQCKKARENTIHSFNQIKNDLNKAAIRNTDNEIVSSTGGMMLGGATLATAFGIAAIPVSLLVVGSIALIGGRARNFFLAKGIKEEQLEKFNDILEADKIVFDSFVNTLTDMIENLKPMAQSSSISTVQSAGLSESFCQSTDSLVEKREKLKQTGKSSASPSRSLPLVQLSSAELTTTQAVFSRVGSLFGYQSSAIVAGRSVMHGVVRGASVSLAGVGIVLDLGLLITTLNNIDSEHELIPFLNASIQQLEAQSRRIHAIMVFATLQRIKLLLKN